MRKNSILHRKAESILSIMNNLLTLLSEKGVKPSELCTAIHISDSTFSTWKKRMTDPPAKYILPICEFLNISFYQLLGEAEDAMFTENITIRNQSPTITNSSNIEVNGIKHQNLVNELSDNEQELLRVFNRLPSKAKIRLLNMVYDYEENFFSENSE